MKRKIAIAVLSLFILTACSNSREKDFKTIKDLETALKADKKSPLDVNKTKELVDAYVKFVKDFPKDTACPGFLFEAAQKASFIKKFQLSVDLLDQIMKDYPTYKNAADCMFLKAFIYDEDLKNIIKAREGYEAFLKKYPTNVWASQVPGLLKWLGKTDEQKAAELREINKNDTLVKK